MDNLNPNLRGKMRAKPAAAYVGVTLGTFRNLCSQGHAPPPSLWIGSVAFWDRGDLDFFKAHYVGRPGRRKSFKKG